MPPAISANSTHHAFPRADRGRSNTVDARRLVVAVLLFFALGNASVFALQTGDTRRQVVIEKGPPVTITQNEERAILRFSDGVEVTFEDNIVVHWEIGKPARAGAAKAALPSTSVDAPTPPPTVAASSVSENHNGPLRDVKIPPLPPSARRSHAEKIAAASVGVGVLFGTITFRLFFLGAEDFFDCIRFRFFPGGHSIFSTDWWVLQKGFFKLCLYLFFAAGAGLVNYAIFR